MEHFLTMVRKVEYNKRSISIYEIAGNNIVRLRGRMKQRELAEKAKISRQTVSKIEDGRPIALSSIVKIADALNVEVAELFIPIEKLSNIIQGKRTRLMDQILKDKDLFIEFIERVVENKYDIKKK